MVEIFDNLTKKLQEYQNVLIMSHKNTDLDGLTSSIVICKIARQYAKKSYVYLDENNEIISKTNYLKDTDYIINTWDNFNPDETLLVILDTNSAIYVEEERLLDIYKHVVLLDHHNKSDGYIKDTEISYVNNNLSSVIEFMVYYLKHLSFEIDGELATLMLAGLEIDTNSFNLKTTPETYKAAGILIEMGASPIAKQEILRESREDILKRYELLKRSYVFKEIVSICVLDEEIHNPIELAQIADELLSFKNIEITFCIGLIDNDLVRISIRTLGNYNAQEIASVLGGGGSMTSAASNINCSLKEAERKVKEMVGEFI